MAKEESESGMTVDEGLFVSTVRRLEGRMYRTAISILWNDADAADAIQECILKAWQRRYRLRDESRVDAWMMRILINECRNIQRGNRRRPAPLETVEWQAAEQEAPDMKLRAALQRLPVQYRLPLIMHHLEGCSLEEISETLRLPMTTLKGRLYQARKRLQAILKEETDI